ncbi:heme exporter protein CcmD [Oxalobacteraceae bacterium GrIS 2.11]
MSNWLAMGGYGLYVWGSVGMVLACLAVELISVRMRFKALLKSE